ncbi:unnamed protein product [Cochlearia groenlandica]
MLLVHAIKASPEFPKFDGIRLSEWFRRCDEFFWLYNTPPDSMTRISSLYMEGSTKTSFASNESFNDGNRNTYAICENIDEEYDEFEEILKEETPKVKEENLKLPHQDIIKVNVGRVENVVDFVSDEASSEETDIKRNDFGVTKPKSKKFGSDICDCVINAKRVGKTFDETFSQWVLHPATNSRESAFRNNEKIVVFLGSSKVEEEKQLVDIPINHVKEVEASTQILVCGTCPYMSNTSPTKPTLKTSFGDRCLLMAKQQRTRIYILRRCVSMLLCWHDHSIHD